jgi:hypothetical protein
MAVRVGARAWRCGLPPKPALAYRGLRVMGYWLDKCIHVSKSKPSKNSGANSFPGVDITWVRSWKVAPGRRLEPDWAP